MEKRITVLYEHALAQYDIQDDGDGYYIALLYCVNKIQEKKPPNKVRIKKEGRHWVEDGVLQDLFDDIGLAIEEYKWKTELRLLKLESPDKKTTQLAPMLPNHYISVQHVKSYFLPF